MNNSHTLPLSAGCYFDNHHGHYIPSMIVKWACDDLGYIISPMERYVIDRYKSDGGNEDYPYESLYEIVDDIIDWLNCDWSWNDEPRPAAARGQNQPPKKHQPLGIELSWGWNDGDFGLYAAEDYDG